MYLIFMLLAAGVAAATNEPDDGQWRKRFYRANGAYAEGDYDRALELYEALVEEGVDSGALYYNIGNCFYKMKDPARAILFYQRARRLIPSDPDLQANYAVALAATAVVAAPGGGNWIERTLARPFSSMTLDGIAIMILLVNAGIFGMLITGMIRPATLGWSRGLAAIFLIAGVWAGIEGLRRLSLYPLEAVVLKETQARFEPQDDSTAYFHLTAGEPVQAVKESRGWTKVRRSDGKTGWIEATVCEHVSLPVR